MGKIRNLDRMGLGEVWGIEGSTATLVPVVDLSEESPIFRCPCCANPVDIDPFVEGSRLWEAECFDCDLRWRTVGWSVNGKGEARLTPEAVWHPMLNRTQLLMLDEEINQR